MRYLLLIVLASLVSYQRAAADIGHYGPLEDYFEQLLDGKDPLEHYDEVAAVLNSYLEYFESTEILIVDSGSGTKLTWDFPNQKLAGTLDDQEIATEPFVDEFGRPSFNSGGVSAWVDVFNDMLFVGVTITNDGSYAYAGDLPDVLDGPEYLLTGLTTATECVCQGSLTTTPTPII